MHASVLCDVKYADAGSVALLHLCVSVLYTSCNHHECAQKHGTICSQLWRRSRLIGLLHFGDSVFVHSSLLRTLADARPALCSFSLFNRHYNFCQAWC